MKTASLLILFTLVSCSVFTPRTRAERYQKCVERMLREGLQQSLIKAICDTAINGESVTVTSVRD